MGHLSIDFRQQELRLLETEGGVKTLKVKKFRVLDLHRDAMEALEDDTAAREAGDTLDRVLAKERFTRDPAGMSLGASYCIFRNLDLPFKNEEQIRRVIKFEVEGSIQIDIDDLVIDFFKKTETLDKSCLMVIGARKEVLARQLSFLQSRDVDPYFVDLDFLCMYNALAGAGFLQEMDRFIVVNVTTGTTHILVIENGRLIAGRAVPLGVGDLRRALEYDLKMARINPQQGVEEILGITSLEPLKVTALESEIDGEASPEAKELFERPVSDLSKEARDLAEQRRTTFLTKLRRELLRTFSAMEMKDRPEKVLVTGSGCRLPGLDKLLGELFHAEVEELDLLSRVAHDLPEDQVAAVNREILAPLGAAYKTAGLDMTHVDLRQEEVQYAKKFDQIKVPLACFTFLLLILVVLLNLQQYMLRRARHIDMEQITELATYKLSAAVGDANLAQKIVNRYEWGLSRIIGIRNAMEAKKRELGDLLGREGTIPELPSVFPVWHTFFAWIQKHQDEFGFFRLNDLYIKMGQKRPTLNFDCEVATGKDESLITHKLIAEVPIFTEIRPGKFVPNEKTGKRVCNGSQVSIDLSKEKASK